MRIKSLHTASLLTLTLALALAACGDSEGTDGFTVSELPDGIELSGGLSTTYVWDESRGLPAGEKEMTIALGADSILLDFCPDIGFSSDQNYLRLQVRSVGEISVGTYDICSTFNCAAPYAKATLEKAGETFGPKATVGSVEISEVSENAVSGVATITIEDTVVDVMFDGITPACP